MSKKQFYEVLYDREDWVAIRNRKLVKDDDYMFLKDNTSPEMLKNYNNPEFICINPVDIESDGGAKNSNIFVYRNFLMEEDGGVPIEEQRAKIKESGLPYSTIVFSGNESAHFIISLEQSLSSEDEYRRWFRTIEKILSTYNYEADSACVNPSRLSRAAEGINIKTGRTQDVLEVKSRISNNHLMEWFKKHNLHPDEFIPKEVEYTSYDGPDTADDARRWDVAKKLMGKDFDYASLGDGKREPARFQLAIKCKECRLSLSAAINYITQEFPSSKGFDKTRQDVERCYATREVEYKNVMSTEDYIAWKESQKTVETKSLFDNLLNDEFNLNDDDIEEVQDLEITADADTELHRYMLVGDDIYFLANRRIYKRKIGTFTLHFNKRELMHVNRYTDFCNEPGYFNYQPVINNHYNNFKIPQWKAKKGDWSTIEHYLRHITNGDENLYQVVLDYLQISLENPKQKLPILLLISYEKDTGKSTFFALLSAMFGDNVEAVTPRNFEMEWNAQWCEKHFVFIDEMEKIKDKETVGGKLKNLVYFPTITKNKKGQDSENIPWNGRFVMTSNSEAGFIEIDDEEDRWLILKVPVRSSFNPDYVDNIKREAKHLIYHLSHRKLSTENNGRGWFTKQQLKTKALETIVHNSKPQIEIDVDRVITEWFESNTDKDECNFILKDLDFKLGAKHTDKEYKETIHKLYDIINDKKYTAEDSFNSFFKKQKNWYTIKRSAVMTNEDYNKSIEDAFNVLSV